MPSTPSRRWFYTEKEMAKGDCDAHRNESRWKNQKYLHRRVNRSGDGNRGAWSCKDCSGALLDMVAALVQTDAMTAMKGIARKCKT